jgi:RNase H-fold protein (predicted Holliday junction resolvase)
MYFERLKISNPGYLKSINSSELFLISLLVASKYLHDDGELDSAINSEWAAAYGISLKLINQMEKDYLSAMNWEFFISDEEFTIRHKQIVDQLYADMMKSNSMLLKMFLMISSVIQNIKKFYRKKIIHQKIKQMIAMSTVITVVTATALQLKMNTGDQKMIQELFDQIESNPNYPMIPSAVHINQIKNSEHIRITNYTKKWSSSKLVQLLDHLLFMNMCVSDKHLTVSKPIKKQFRNITYFKNIIFFNYLTTANCIS